MIMNQKKRKYKKKRSFFENVSHSFKMGIKGVFVRAKSGQKKNK